VETLIRRCAELDVHKASVVACVRVIDENGELLSFTQSFGTTTSDLLKLNDWLMSYAVTVVGMESTGVYWKPVYTLLEAEFECWLLNAQHLRNVPGRKTDVADAAWIAQLVAHGLVRPSFVPPKEIRELRELTRYRKAVIQDRSREAQRLHKTLESAGRKARMRARAAGPHLNATPRLVSISASPVDDSSISPAALPRTVRVFTTCRSDSTQSADGSLSNCQEITFTGAL
jgi:transposase